MTLIINRPGLYCKWCGAHLKVKDVLTIFCPNKNCGSKT